MERKIRLLFSIAACIITICYLAAIDRGLYDRSRKLHRSKRSFKMFFMDSSNKDAPLYSGWIIFAFVMPPFCFVSVACHNALLEAICWIYLIVHWILFICKRYRDLDIIAKAPETSESVGGKTVSRLFLDLFSLYLISLINAIPIVRQFLWEPLFELTHWLWGSQVASILYGICYCSCFLSLSMCSVYAVLGSLIYGDFRYRCVEDKISQRIEKNKATVLNHNKNLVGFLDYVDDEIGCGNKKIWFLTDIVYFFRCMAAFLKSSMIDGFGSFAVIMDYCLLHILRRCRNMMKLHNFICARKKFVELSIVIVLLSVNLYLLKQLENDSIVTHFFEFVNCNNKLDTLR